MNDKQKGLIELLHKNGIWLQDTLSVINDLRPCMRFAIDKERFLLLRKVLPKLNLKMIIYNYKAVGKPVCVVGKDSSILKKAYLSDKDNQSKLGEYLGYPSCCIESFQENKKSVNTIPILTKQNSKKNDYRLNYLFNFDTRIQTWNLGFLNKIKKERYCDYDKYIIPHIPCSFDCKPSLKYANSLMKIMSREFTEYSKELKTYLNRIFLFLDNYKFLAFEGNTANSELNYSKVMHFNTLFDKEKLVKIRAGNRIRWSKDKISIFKDNSKISDFRVSSEIIGFE